MNENNRQGVGANVADNVTATGANPNLPGFADANLDSHWNTHKDEYSGLTKEQYSQRAQDLLQSPTGDNVLGYKTLDGAVVRYDRTTRDFVKGYDTGIATMFLLRGGETRFAKIMQREGGFQND